MFGWSITLIVIGGLSFVLPLFGRQFILVSALGLTGIGSVLAGIILFVVGLALFIGARNKESQKFAVRIGNKWATPVNSASNIEARKNSSVNLSSVNAATTKSSGTSGEFSFADNEAMSPLEYGLHAVKLAIAGSEKGTKQLVGTSESTIQQKISSQSGPVQIHLLALQAAAFYVCADKLCASKRNVLADVATGISTGFCAIFGDHRGAEKDSEVAQFLYELFKEYAPLLARELDEYNNDNPFDFGVTANLAAQYIGKQCGIDQLLAENQSEKMGIELIASTNGIRLLLNLLAHRNISFAE